MPEFKPGLYRHYKGGLYRAIQMVLYVALEHPGSLPQVRSLDHDLDDSWNDWVYKDGRRSISVRPDVVRRFEYVQP